MNFRRGGAWGIWHIVKDEDSMPLCGTRSRLQNDVVTPPESTQQKVLRGETRACGSCVRIAVRRENRGVVP